MKRTYLAFAAALAMGLSSAVSAAPLFWIDDFTSTPPNPFSASLATQGQSASDGPEGYTLMGNAFNRAVLFENIADTNSNPNSGVANLDISFGELNISNGSNVQSRTTLTYDISSLDALLGDDNTFLLNVTFSDGVGGVTGDPAPTSITAILNGNQIGVWSLGAPIYSGTTGGGMYVAGSMLTGMNDVLQVIINGPAGYDLTVDAISLDVPEPGMIGLFGLGIAGLAFARRRKS